MNVSPAIEAALRQKLSVTNALQFLPAGVGSINQTCCIEAGSRRLFCKLNSATQFPALFEKEKRGLEFIASQGCLKTPAVIDCFEAEGQQVLLLEWIVESDRTNTFWQKFGEGLAALHCTTVSAFGLDEDNYMGSVPQRNGRHGLWTDFLARERLWPVMKLCFDRKLLSKTHRRQFEVLDNKLPDFFAEEAPSLLHGDLWSGNFLCDQQGEPVLIDPAVYYGHRSMDLAMTTLFGGFAPSFYEAYHHHFPLPENHREQWAICNLYPLLIHLYLFGTQYLPQIERTLKRFE